jgi:hypothetical protein
MATSFRVALMNEGRGFSRATALALMRALQAAEKLGFVSGHGFSRAAQSGLLRALAPEVRFSNRL